MLIWIVTEKQVLNKFRSCLKYDVTNNNSLCENIFSKVSQNYWNVIAFRNGIELLEDTVPNIMA